MGDEDRSRSGWGRGGVQTDFGDEASGRSYVGNEGRGYGYGPDYRRDQWDYGREGDRGRERSDYGRQGGYGREGGYSSRGYDRGGYGRDDDRGGYGDRDRGERGWWDRTRDEVASWFGDDDAERRRQQDFRGRGPKGYRRSDERIKEDISDRLADDWQVDASEIDVGVSNAEVTLSGTVDSRDARRRAEDIAEQVSGVSHVQNNIRVRQQASSSSSWQQGTSSGWQQGGQQRTAGSAYSGQDTGGAAASTTTGVTGSSDTMGAAGTSAGGNGFGASRTTANT